MCSPKQCTGYKTNLANPCDQKPNHYQDLKKIMICDWAYLHNNLTIFYGYEALHRLEHTSDPKKNRVRVIIQIS